MWSSRRRILGALLAVIVGSSALINASAIYADTNRYAPTTRTQSGVIQHIVAFLREVPGYCYGGIFPATGSHLLPWYRDVNIMLFYWGCGQRAGKPIYVEINDTYEGTVRTPVKHPEFTPIGDDLTPLNVITIDPFWEREILGTARNRFEANRGIERTRTMKNIMLTTKEYSFSEIRGRFASRGNGPQLYSSGIVFAYRSPKDFTSVTLSDNHAFVTTWNDGKPHVNTLRPLMRLSPEFTFIVRRNNQDCLVFVDDFLVTHISDCSNASGQIGVLSWDNGTPGEALKQLKVLPLDNPTTATWSESSLRPISRFKLISAHR